MDEGQRAIDGISRRNVLRGGLLAGAGLATVGAVSGVLTGTAKASTPNPQPDWGWCQYCATMWWTPGRSGSSCSSPEAPNGLHAVGSGSYNYYQVNNQSTDTPTGNPQSDWYWCTKCQGLFWAAPRMMIRGFAGEILSSATWGAEPITTSGTIKTPRRACNCTGAGAKTAICCTTKGHQELPLAPALAGSETARHITRPGAAPSTTWSGVVPTD